MSLYFSTIELIKFGIGKKSPWKLFFPIWPSLQFKCNLILHNLNDDEAFQRRSEKKNL